MKYEFQVRMQQRHLRVIVGGAAQALPCGIGNASVAFRTQARFRGKRCHLGTGFEAEGR